MALVANQTFKYRREAIETTHDDARLNSPRNAPRSRIRTIPPDAWPPLKAWLIQAEHLYEEVIRPADIAGIRPNPQLLLCCPIYRPDASLLVTAAREWPDLCAYGAEAIWTYPFAEGPAIRASFKKPKHKGERSHRDFDPAAFGFIATALVCGGHFVLEPKGDREQFFYPRVYVAGRTHDGQLRRAQGMRVIAGTAVGTHTVEPKGDYHDLRRCSLRFRPPSDAEPIGLYNDADVREWALERFREVTAEAPEKLPPDLTEERYRLALDVSLAVLRALPLGTHGGTAG